MNLIYEYLRPTMLSIEFLKYLEYFCFFQNKIGFVKKKKLIRIMDCQEQTYKSNDTIFHNKYDVIHGCNCNAIIDEPCMVRKCDG
jgi:hypothetical protein